MIETTILSPGVTLRCFRDTRFKQGCLSFQFVRPMAAEEAHLNALLPSVLLRATEPHPDLRAISQHLDSLYGVSLGALVRRIGDYQTTGFHCTFMDDRFALPGESVLAGVVDFLEEMLTRSPLLDGGFLPELVESEKRNLIATIESELNNKGAYALGKLLKSMGREDTIGLPRLGEKEAVAAIDPVALHRHYRKIRRESPLEIFYVGSADSETIATLMKTMVEKWDRNCGNLQPQTGLRAAAGAELTERMDIAQGKLSLGFTTPILSTDRAYPALHAFHILFGAGMTSRLFMTVREKKSLCYSIGSGLIATKGIFTVSAGIDFEQEAETRQEIFRQLEDCQQGGITEEELTAAKEAICSGLRSVMDSPGAIENYYSTLALSGRDLDREAYLHTIERLTLAEVTAAANSLQYHSGIFLKGVEA